MFDLHSQKQIPGEMDCNLNALGHVDVPIKEIKYNNHLKGVAWKQERVTRYIAENPTYSLDDHSVSVSKKVVQHLQDPIESTFFSINQKVIDVQRLAGKSDRSLDESFIMTYMIHNDNIFCSFLLRFDMELKSKNKVFWYQSRHIFIM